MQNPLEGSDVGAAHHYVSSDLLADSMFDYLPAAAFVCDARGFIVRYNGKAVELWGRRPLPEDRFSVWANYFLYADGTPMPPEDSPVARVLASGLALKECEIQVVLPGQRERWVQVDINPLIDGQGVVQGAISCFHDITTRKHSELLLQQSEAFLEGIVQATPECIKVVREDGSLIQMNQAGLCMLGVDNLLSVLGASIYDVIAPEDREQWTLNHKRVCAGESLSWTFDIIGLTGIRHHMETHAVPLTLPDGQRAQLGVTRNITQRRKDEQALRESEQHLREVLEGLATAVYTTDAQGYLTFYNEAAVKLWGYRPQLGECRWCGSWQVLRPNGQALPPDEYPITITLQTGRAFNGEEAILVRKDGTQIPFAAFPTPLRNSQGTVVGAVNMLVDISRHKAAEAQQSLLINELNHRVKNTLMTVQSIATYSLRNASPDRSYRETFNARLMALSRTHDLLTHSQWEGACLKDILEQEFAPYRMTLDGSDSGRIVLEGEDFELEPREVLTLALVFHEMMTNAAKYGALSVAHGCLTVRWRVALDETAKGSRYLDLRWLERGGPIVQPPERQGFGTRLIERSIIRELKGQVRNTFAPEGVESHLLIPLTCLQDRPKGNFV
ncbi:PAS domain S-box-containing protein [Pseudomonas duriflava]|uniref:histidine kinase n=1 Tax=Pseudomonas duriflava TaxID=459528 RepID=A0A562Q451_9PSED|nr:PAS domain S-box protein [Pseudomonas duriflava]TWI50930.1 PAS domain S-box-containing protein [Pseudomonas duriflava]